MKRRHGERKLSNNETNKSISAIVPCVLLPEIVVCLVTTGADWGDWSSAYDSQNEMQFRNCIARGHDFAKDWRFNGWLQWHIAPHRTLCGRTMVHRARPSKRVSMLGCGASPTCITPITRDETLYKSKGNLNGEVKSHSDFVRRLN
jgi:hypothetical protein